MKQLLLILLVLLSIDVVAQDCTREITQAIPTILEKGFNNKPYAVKDGYGKKLGDTFYSLFASAIQQSKGLHGNFNIMEANNHLPGLLGYDAYAYMFYVYCRKDGKLDWKGLWNLSFGCISNYLTERIGKELSNELIGVGSNHFVYQDNAIIYMLEQRKSGSELNGYPFIEAANGNTNNAVLITKRGIPFFLPVTRRQYLALMRKSAEMSIVAQKKGLATYIKDKPPEIPITWEEHKKCCLSELDKQWMKNWNNLLLKHPEHQIKFDAQLADLKKKWEIKQDKDKTEVEDAISLSISYCLKDIKEIDGYISGHTETYLNKPCITNHNLETLFGIAFGIDKDYFFDDPGAGKEWVIINPGYINKKLPASIPQFFSVSWGQGEKEVEKKAALLFKQDFDFKKMEDLLGK